LSLTRTHSNRKTSGHHTTSTWQRRIDEILAQRQPTRTLKDSEAREGERPRQDTMSDTTLAKKHHRDQIDALLRKM
jgi:predicted RNase H-like nuclease